MSDIPNIIVIAIPIITLFVASENLAGEFLANPVIDMRRDIAMVYNDGLIQATDVHVHFESSKEISLEKCVEGRITSPNTVEFERMSVGITCKVYVDLPDLNAIITADNMAAVTYTYGLASTNPSSATISAVVLILSTLLAVLWFLLVRKAWYFPSSAVLKHSYDGHNPDWKEFCRRVNRKYHVKINDFDALILHRIIHANLHDILLICGATGMSQQFVSRRISNMQRIDMLDENVRIVEAIADPLKECFEESR